ncbi:hypothetical protein SEA_FRAYBELL_156 [Mycobacterium phage FrayBell]|nr:hypothetical protein SEA_BONRAY_152 [Mycobacterium phage Bonray]QAY06373.1 hypothetical protein SEA_FRAYBELL_156 [Mycobacterium phage FrayBell]QAY14412.1 hypothetical protein SEA_DARKO_151 [Mycobacterium phage Darko]QWY80742.1 hypothetical protein SEA_BANANAFENCE_150 [Mycobacterium phage BananaFence]
MSALTLPATINETSFAVAYTDATALVLDAVALTGSARKEKLAQARGRLQSALAFASLPEESVLVRQLNATLNFYAQQGLDA